MPDYPRSLELEPITDWPGQLATTREIAKFRTPRHLSPITGKMVPAAPVKLTTTMSELSTELDALKGKNPRLGIAVTKEALRLDGRLRAGAQPFHPGVILTFDTPQGEMRYANDRFTRWEDNLRGIVKELEALRGITRWVNNGGQQYGGFLAIESARSMPAGFTNADAAWHFIKTTAGYGADENPTPRLIRDAYRVAHPDVGGDAETFQRVSLAEQYLRQNGHLS
jgi:hypothetical protein